MKIIRGKKGFIGIDKIILIVLVVIVVAVVAWFLFKGDVLRWIKNLPGDEPKGDRELTAEEIEALGLEICNHYFAVVRGGQGQGNDPIVKCNGGERKSCAEASRVETGLYIDADSEDRKIYVTQQGVFGLIDWIKKDIAIGEISKGTVGKVEMYDEIINKRGELYNNVIEFLPDRGFLLNLNGANFFANYFCRIEKGGIKEIDEIKEQGRSNILTIELYDTSSLQDNDFAYAYWDFVKATGITVRPSGKDVSGISDRYFFVIDGSINTLWDNDKIKFELHNEDKEILKKISNSEGFSHFALNVKEVLDKKRGEVNGMKKLTEREIWKLLFGTENSEEIKEILGINDGENPADLPGGMGGQFDPSRGLGA